MKSFTSNEFLNCFSKLPERIKIQARKYFKIWKKNPYYKSLKFKKLKNTSDIYSVRIGIGYRALGFKDK